MSNPQLTFSGFNSLQTGRYIQSHFLSEPDMLQAFRFNSLQTGRYIQRVWRNPAGRVKRDEVSIPFKREGISKEAMKVFFSILGNDGFNSLQTGRYIQSKTEAAKPKPAAKCFNSLQTGRYIQR